MVKSKNQIGCHNLRKKNILNFKGTSPVVLHWHNPKDFSARKRPLLQNWLQKVRLRFPAIMLRITTWHPQPCLSLIQILVTFMINMIFCIYMEDTKQPSVMLSYKILIFRTVTGEILSLTNFLIQSNFFAVKSADFKWL